MAAVSKYFKASLNWPFDSSACPTLFHNLALLLVTPRPEMKIADSSFQSKFRRNVLREWTVRRKTRMKLKNFWLKIFFCIILEYPNATRRENPMEGMYKTLSAITNPTGKNKLEAGRKGTAMIAMLSNTTSHPRRKRPTRATLKNPKTKMMVDRFRGSARDVINGIEPMVQSQQRSLGDNRSQKFLAIK